MYFSCYIIFFFFSVNDETKIFWFNLESKDNHRETPEGCVIIAETWPAWQSPCFLFTGGDGIYSFKYDCWASVANGRLLVVTLNHSIRPCFHH